MQETKSINCKVSEENNEVRLWQCFGWTLLSSQEVNIVDNRLESDISGNVYQTTSRERYIKLVFSRDTKMKNYSQLVSLEKEYDSLKTQYHHAYLFSFIKFIFFNVIYLTIYIIKKKKVNEENRRIDIENAAILEKKRKLLERAKGLVD